MSQFIFNDNVTANVGITTPPSISSRIGSLTAFSLSASQITVTAGNSAVPAISPVNDTNTGIYFPAADTIAFAQGGVEAMRINPNNKVSFTSVPLLSAPVFRSIHQYDQLVQHNTTTKLSLTSILIDTNGCYNRTQHRFIPNIAGYYHVGLNIVAEDNSGNNKEFLIQAKIYKNGDSQWSTPDGGGVLDVQHVESSKVMSQGGTFALFSPCLIYMNGSTDYLEPYFYHYDYTSNGPAR